MKIDVLTLFPDMFACLHHSVIGRAMDNGIITVNAVNIRDHTLDKHNKCDDYPFGGGAGMVMMAQPIYDAIQAVDPEHKARRIYLSPCGETLSTRKAVSLSKYENILLLCGHYEGVDQRVIDLCIDEELSIGDYVLTGGELAAMVTIDAVARQLDNVLGSGESLTDESFTNGLLEYPQYTRPQVFRGVAIPEVLVSGNHAEVDKWRLAKSRELTAKRRADLLRDKE